MLNTDLDLTNTRKSVLRGGGLDNMDPEDLHVETTLEVLYLPRVKDAAGFFYTIHCNRGAGTTVTKHTSDDADIIYEDGVETMASAIAVAVGYYLFMYSDGVYWYTLEEAVIT